MNCPHCGKDMEERFAFCPHCGTRQRQANPFEGQAAPVPEDPWAVGGAAYAPSGAEGWEKSAPASPKKNRRVHIAALGVLVVLIAASVVFNLVASGSRCMEVIDSYFSYASTNSTGAMEALYHPAVLERAIEDFGRTGALAGLDSMARYGLELEEYEVVGTEDYNYALVDFNEEYGVQATRLTEVWLDSYFTDGTSDLYCFTLVQEDGVWYLIEIY